MRRAGLAGYTLHSTRHAHATLMLRQGVHPKIVQERLGHSRVGVTLDIYSHVTPGLQEAAALRFEEGLVTARERRKRSRLLPDCWPECRMGAGRPRMRSWPRQGGGLALTRGKTPATWHDVGFQSSVATIFAILIDLSVHLASASRRPAVSALPFYSELASRSVPVHPPQPDVPAIPWPGLWIFGDR